MLGHLFTILLSAKRFMTITLFAAPLFTPTNTPLLPAPSKSSKPEVILFVGYPCLGKTTFYHRHIQPLGYKHVTQVILKRRDKCVQAVEEALAAGDSCVVGMSPASFELPSLLHLQTTPTVTLRQENTTWT